MSVSNVILDPSLPYFCTMSSLYAIVCSFPGPLEVYLSAADIDSILTLQCDVSN